jgi:hypothetical protein
MSDDKDRYHDRRSGRGSKTACRIGNAECESGNKTVKPVAVGDVGSGDWIDTIGQETAKAEGSPSNPARGHSILLRIGKPNL